MCKTPLYWIYTQLNRKRIEQEEYITLQRAQRIGLVETDTAAAMEWTWERKTNVRHEQVVLYRNVPRYRGQDIHVSSKCADLISHALP